MPVRYQYVKIPLLQNPVTIAYKIISKSYDPILLLEAGFSVCHKKDKFSKEIGRKIAEGRMNKKPFFVAFANQNTSVSFGKRIVGSIYSYVEKNIEEIMSQNQNPTND